jgi:hypothetical protein
MKFLVRGLRPTSADVRGRRFVHPRRPPIESGEKLIAFPCQKYIITKAPAHLDWAKFLSP